MSYILDALRRADAERERERGAVPNLHAQPAASAVAPPRRWHPAAYYGLAAAAAVVAAVLWWWPGGRVVDPPPGAPQVAAPAAPVVPAAVPAPASPPLVVPPPLLVVTAPVVPVPASAPEAATAARPAETPVTRLTELPPELRNSWPVMAIGGAIYSDSPAGRFVIVNGQVVREGETAAPGVTVERIGPKSAIVRWKEMRLEVPF